MDLESDGLYGGQAHLMTPVLCVEFTFGSRHPERLPTLHPHPAQLCPSDQLWH